MSERTGERHFSRWSTFNLLAVAASLSCANAANAQTITGPFQMMDGWWLHPTQGTLGISTDGVNIFIDRDGDGVAQSSYPIPSPGGVPLAVPNMRLTPTREILYAFGGSCGLAGTSVYFFDVPAPPAGLTLLDSACIEFGIGSVGFYDTGLCTFNGIGLECPAPPGPSPYRRAYIADMGNIFEGRVKIYWFDLNNGEHAATPNGFHSTLQLTRVPISPNGDVAFVEHGVGSTSDYTLIDLCPLPRLGDPLSSNAGGELFAMSGTATAEMVDVGGGDFAVRVTHPDLLGGSSDFTFVPCGGVAPDPDGACCEADGSCALDTSDACGTAGGAWLGPDTTCAECPPPTGGCCTLFGCVPDMSETGCTSVGGTWQGPGSSCAGCPPPLQLTISKTAPASIVEGAEMTYDLFYENTGGQLASGVTIMDTLPVGTSFVSATNGGTLAGANVTWQIGTVAVGASGTVSFTVTIDCGQTVITNANYRALVGFFPFVGAPVSTTVIPAGTAPVNVTVVSIPARDPLQRSDAFDHAITLTNTVAEQRLGINLQVDWGWASDLDTMIDAAGGAVEFSGSSSMTWTGDIPPLGAVTIQFRTRIKECATWHEERLNEGSELRVKNSCNVEVGTATPPAAIPIQRPTAGTMLSMTAGPPQDWFGQPHQAVRAGTADDIQLVLSSLISAPQTVSINHVIPAQMTPIGDPPFVPPTDPAATYDAPSRTILWSGTIPPQSDVLITYQVTYSAQPCRIDSYLSGDTGTCSGDISAAATLLLVPEPRTDSHLLNLHPFNGVKDAFPLRQIFCLTPEIYFGMGRGANWNVFVAGLPNFWFNPATLDFWVLDHDGPGGVPFAEIVLGIPSNPLLKDVAVDPRDGTALFLGSNQITPPLLGAIGRYDPVTDQVTPLVALEDLHEAKRIVVGSDGVIATVGSQSGVMQIDPDDPTNPLLFSDPRVPNPTCIAIEPTGNYIVANWGPPKKLARVDRVTGVFTILVDDLDSLVPTFEPPTSAAIGASGEVYLMTGSSGGMIVTLGNPPSAQPLFLGYTSDIESVVAPAACMSPDLDNDGAVDLDDYQLFEPCLLGPGGGIGGGAGSVCTCADHDSSGHVDLKDIAHFQLSFTGN